MRFLADVRSCGYLFAASEGLRGAQACRCWVPGRGFRAKLRMRCVLFRALRVVPQVPTTKLPRNPAVHLCCSRLLCLQTLFIRRS